MKKPALHSISVAVIMISFGLTGCAGETRHNVEGDAVADTAWTVLFDGTSTDHWRGYDKDHLPAAWRIEDGALAFVPGDGEGGDIISKEEFEDFEMELEWKISPAGNSGIFFDVVESPDYDAVYLTGPEMQVLDNAGHADGQLLKHRAGDLYDLIESASEAARPVGEWNKVRIRQDHGHLTFWLNGVKTVETEMWTPEWDAMVAGSKFKDMPDFARTRRGHLALQDHGNRVWYRNIRVRAL